MNPCCPLGSEFNSKENILYETDNFFIVPSIGQIGIEGYLLVCSKDHYIGIGGMPEEYQSELEDVLMTTRNVLSSYYNSEVLVFEHGPRIGCHRGGGCLDHSHLHILPISVNLMEPLVIKFLHGIQIDDFYKLERVEDFKRLNDIYGKQESSYLFIETVDLKRYVTEVNFIIPSQYLRQIVAHTLGRMDRWDWRTKPDYETFETTVINLKGKF